MKKQIKTRPCISEHIDFPESLHPVLRNVYQRRKFNSPDELDASLQRLTPFQQLMGIDEAAALLEEALQADARIVVVGDFDADGATSTAVAIKALRMLGANDVHFRVPNRFKYGYGLTRGIIDEIVPMQADLIITVDNGIASIDGVAYAKQHGLSVLVTDHHLAAAELPDADAIVNPNQPGDDFPSKCLAGVGVIFYVMLALRARLRESGWFHEKQLAEPNMGSLLDIVALGTVADVVPLDHNNRILVNQGLKRIRAGLACPGIQALLEVSKRQASRLVATDLGFALGPRLNAAGRLEDMSIGIECLLSESLPHARQLAQRLDGLNMERRAIETEMKAQALDDLQRLHLDEEQSLPLGLCIYQEDWHQGVIGILASRIKDHLHRPVIAFADEDEENIKGSARSVSGVHIRDVLDAIATRHPGLLNKFGGHAMAAGLSLPKARFADFQQAFDEEVRKHVSEEELKGIQYTDGNLNSKDFNMQVAEIIRDAGPWGQEFPEPVFSGEFQVINSRVVGEKHLKLTLSSADSGPIDAIGFNMVEEGSAPPLQTGDQAELAFKLDINEFRGERKLQLILECLAD